MENKFYIHIGYPKTGTTFLQNKIFTQLTSFNYIGKNNSKHNSIYEIFYQYLFFNDNSNNKKLISFFNNKLAKGNLLISEEDILYNSLRFSNLNNSIHYRFPLKRLQDLIKSLDGCQPIFIITERNTWSLIKSIYGQSYTNFYSTISEYNTFEKFKINFLLNNDPENPNWTNFIETLRISDVKDLLDRFFPDSKIIVQNYKIFNQNPELFISRIFHKTDLKPDDKEYIRNVNFREKLNSRSHENSIKYVTNDNVLFYRLLKFRNKYFPKLNLKSNFIKSYLKTLKSGEKVELSLVFSEEEKNILLNYLNKISS